MAQIVKNLLAMQETRVQSLGQVDRLEKGMATPAPVFLPGEPCPWGRKESDTAEGLSSSIKYGIQ